MKALVVATGPSLKQEQIDYAQGKVDLSIAVNDAYKLMPWADVLYSSDWNWWEYHKAEDFCGEKLCPIETIYATKVEGSFGAGFSPTHIHYGLNSGFAAINLALLRGATQVYLLGFDMGIAEGQERHFFGPHPEHLEKDSNYVRFREKMDEGARTLSRFGKDIKVINCTDGGVLESFPRKIITEVL